jgi:hypothetical protein
VRTPFPMIADTATRLDAAKAKALRQKGVRTVFRYYSHLPPSLPGKDLQPEEAKIILGEGLSLGAVFQHYNNCFRTFENKWGREDAEQALRMAEAIKQPEGSAIYFGVDGDWPWQSMLDAVTVYFEDVHRAFEGSGLAVGIYSNGCTCNVIREKGFASYFWLSGSTGHSGSQAFYNTGKWTMFQNALDINLASAGLGVDTNIANANSGGYFGQFDSSGAHTSAHGDSSTRALIASRRFVRAASDVKTVPDAASATLGSLRKDLNVCALGQQGLWTRVLTQEGGASRTNAALDGWLATSALAPMDRFPDAAANYGLCGSTVAAPETAKT